MIGIVILSAILLIVLIKAHFRNRAVTEFKPVFRTVYPSANKPKIWAEEIDYGSKRNRWVAEQSESLIEKRTVLTLLQSLKVLEIRYPDLLACYEWHYKRIEVLKRDLFKCTNCGVSSFKLHIHHKYYLINRLPWEIDNDALVALCGSCHYSLHKKEIIPVYELSGGQLIRRQSQFRVCSRCNGAGIFLEYMHVQAGICFKCWGDCIDRTIFSERLKVISDDPIRYDMNKIFDESMKFLNGINTDYYKKIIYEIEQKEIIIPGPSSSKKNGKNEEIDDLPF